MVLTHFDNFGFLKVTENSAIDLLGEIPCGVGGWSVTQDGVSTLTTLAVLKARQPRK